MVMGLGFQVAADILKTALAPTWNDILLVAALIALRTVPSYLLEAELEKVDARRALAAGDGDQPGKWGNPQSASSPSGHRRRCSSSRVPGRSWPKRASRSETVTKRCNSV